MEREINFIIKKGVDCSWCVDLMKKTLVQNFRVKKIEIDVLNKKASMIFRKAVNPGEIINFLRKRGYILIVERLNKA